jgi:hypothetical protein
LTIVSDVRLNIGIPLVAEIVGGLEELDPHGPVRATQKEISRPIHSDKTGHLLKSHFVGIPINAALRLHNLLILLLQNITIFFHILLGNLPAQNVHQTLLVFASDDTFGVDGISFNVIYETYSTTRIALKGTTPNVKSHGHGWRSARLRARDNAGFREG